MTDLEMTRLCAEAMGDDAWTDINGRWYCHVRGQETIFAPLIDDAQAMALVKKFRLSIDADCGIPKAWQVASLTAPDTVSADLNRAICECVAKMQAAKEAA